ncbi:serine/threonine protein phosphatase, partial [Anabaena sp. UHCC 0399]|nr:serine/threonine protein phosphatase [Anabaena sp. UHCC 0399]
DVADRLIEIANTKNGHDNVTIALVHYQVKYSEPESAIQVIMPDSASIPTVNAAAQPTSPTLLESDPGQQTKVLRQKTNFRNLPLNLITLFIFLLAAGVFGYWIKLLRSPQTNTNGNVSNPPNTPPLSNQQQRSLDNLQTGWVIRTTNKVPLGVARKSNEERYLKVLEKTNNDNVSFNVCLNPGESQASPQKVTFKLSELKSWQVEVLQPSDDFTCNTSSVDNSSSTSESKPSKSNPTQPNNQNTSP